MNETKRIAFLTTEFPTEYKDGGGLSNYLGRITRVLVDQGHRPEVFVLSACPEMTFEWDSVIVHRVAHALHHPLIRLLYWLTNVSERLHFLNSSIYMLAGGLGLARSLATRERETRFEIIQCADFLATGLFVERNPYRPIVVRCSSATKLYADADHDFRITRKLETMLEIASIKRADIRYAPSNLVAAHYNCEYGISVDVIRPPIFIETKPNDTLPDGLPDRYLIHFGQLKHRKGTSWIAEALLLAWEREPDLTMVFVGEASVDDRARWQTLWDAQNEKVVWLGRLQKPDLYAVLNEAEAAVLPSLVDNLPNTIIESLAFGIPVIGSAGASIDELVEEGISGSLVPLGNIEALADTMVSYWRGNAMVKKGFSILDKSTSGMSPNEAVTNLIKLAY